MKIAVFPGSFDPFTYGHLDILKRCLSDFDKIYVLVAINKDKNYEISSEKRAKAISDVVKVFSNVEVDYTDGMTVDFANKVGAKFIIRSYRNDEDLIYENNVISIYKEMNPSLEIIMLKSEGENSLISSSLVKELIKKGEDISNYVPPQVAKLYLK